MPDGSNPTKQTHASRPHFLSYIAVRPVASQITLDGVILKTGTFPPIEYFSHSDQGGVINRFPPTS